jgi:hypothetical protein
MAAGGAEARHSEPADDARDQLLANLVAVALNVDAALPATNG